MVLFPLFLNLSSVEGCHSMILLETSRQLPVKDGGVGGNVAPAQASPHGGHLPATRVSRCPGGRGCAF